MSYTPLPNAKKANFSEVVAKQRNNPAIVNPAHKELEELGIQGKTTVTQMKDADGNPMFDKQGNPMYRQVFEAQFIPDWYQRGTSVLEGRIPCWFNGCQQIVDEYKAELEKAKSAGGCSMCKKGQLQRTYLRKIRDSLSPAEINKVAQPTSPPMILKNLDTNEVKKIERKPVAYATIKRIVPDELKSRFTKHVEERKLFVDANATSNIVTRSTEVPRPTSPSAS